MRKLLLIVLSLAVYGTANAQTIYQYNFNGNFNEMSGIGPALDTICSGMFEDDTLIDYNNRIQTVYKFDQNCGFSFNDSASNMTGAGTYTIELYFKMTSLNSWKRVIDFKDRTSDKGCYVLNGQMNFYNIATSSGTPIAVNEYTHYVITRNDTNKHVMMYGDGDKFIEFTDNQSDAVYGTVKKIAFFHDDLVVQNEASSGAIALLKIYNYAMDSQVVKQHYNNLDNTLGVANAQLQKGTMKVYPNPATAAIYVSLPAAGDYTYAIVDVVGRNIQQGALVQKDNEINITGLPYGMYVLDVADKAGNRYVQKFVKQ